MKEGKRIKKWLLGAAVAVLTVQCHGESKEFNRTLQKFAVA